MKTNFAYRLVSFVSSLSILLQSFAPLAYITPQIVLSQEPLKNTITYNNSKGVFHFEVNNKDAEVTSGPILYTLLYKNELTGQIQSVNGKTDLGESNFSRDIDAATCSSGGVCVNHVVHQGLMKVKVDKANWFDSQWFKIEGGNLVVKHQYATGSVADLTSDEEHWLSTGEEMIPSPTPTVVPTAEPTVEPTITPTEIPTPTITVMPTTVPSLGDEEVQVKVVKLDGSYADPTLVPETWTDKMDYAPTEKVVVSGKNFIADYEYTIVISSSDDPAVTHTGTFTALSDGTFTYEYQLDGNYRPNYKVEIKDATGTVVATTTFLDHHDYDMVINNDDDATTSQTVVLNMSWDTLWLIGIDPVQARYANIDEGDKCSSSSTIWSSWEDISDGGGNTASKTWSLTSGAGIKKVCTETRHKILLLWSTESSSDTIEYNPLPPTQSITLCHWDNGQGGKWTSNTVSINSVNQCSNVHGHGNHQSDIIPSFTYETCTYNGSNLSTNYSGFTGQAILNNGCLIPTQSCGDGIKNGSEECDDGNSVNTDACLNTCENATCGDGVTSVTEECDDANSVNTDACTNTCKLPTCGDGYLYSATESCDRGADNTDAPCTAPYGESCTYCTASCSEQTVTGPSCGDGVINGTEQCDGTNLGGLSTTDFRCNSCSLELINPKVTICHATSSQKNPYIMNTPDKSGDVSGHDGHDGPVWFPGITVDWGDIIPAFAYIGGTYPGQNWTTEGQAIYDNGCELPKAKLIVKKEVINDNGGTKGVTNFSFKVDTASAVAFEADGQNDLSVDPGIYTITEPADLEYTTTYDNCSNVTVPIGGSATCTITNDDNAASLTLTKVVINDNGGTKTASDFAVQIDGVTKTWGTQAVDAGTHTVSETTQTGYTASKWGGDCSAKGEITLLPGERKTCTITNDDDIPSLTLKKEVINNNGGNAVPTDWTLTATGPTTLSGAGIATSGATFAAGTYTLTESGLTGYTAGSWSCTNDVAVTRGTITLSPGQSTVCTIVNDDIAPTVTLVKELVGKDGIGDLNFGLTVGGTSVTSGETLEVNANTQIALNEEGLPGYKFVSMGGTSESDRCPEVLGGTVTLNEGQNISCTITNEYVPAELTIAKYNTTWPTTTTPGSEVKYTLKLKVAKNNINNLLVVDLPANGFKYKTGSYNVQIDGVDVTSSIPEPQYHSPGKWELGNIELGDNEEVEILLSYTATIDPNQKPGLYKDLAWAYGTEAGEDTGTTRLLASSVDAGTADPGIITEQFVGSKVAINKETQSTTSVDVKKTETSTGEVLGASTTLPGTGASTIWTYIMSLLIGFGALSILMAILLKKGLLKKITLFASALLLLGGMFMLPVVAHAADPDLTIRISEPKTPINQKFDLIFVALDTQLTRPLTVRCYKKGPSDAVYSQFGSDIAVIAGGNSGQCDVTDSLLSQKGTYNFYTTVEADAGAVSSQVVAVDYNSTEGPGTPTNYSKDSSSSCHPKISFKTSDDGGKTVKVEIYRSENTSFGVDAGNRVGIVTIGSNTDGSYTDTVPDCKKTYYYVIRAFDTAGNGSSVIGDSVVTTTTSTTTTATTTTAVAGGAIPVSGGNIPSEAQVLGEQTTVTPGAEQGSVLGKQTTIENKSGIGKVLGAMTSKSMRPWYIALAVLAIGIIGYVIYKKKNKNKENTPVAPPQA